MVHKFQELEDYDSYDPVPYQGGYDIAARYGAIKPADKKSRSQFGVEPPVAQYGNERNPYAQGWPGPSIYGGGPKPGAVYGGGRDRTQPNKDSAQPDKGSKGKSASNSNGKSASNSTGKSKPEEEMRKPRAIYDYEVSEESGYRKLKSIYDEEHKPAYNEAESAYRQPYYGHGEPYRQSYSEVDQYGYRNPFFGYDNPFYSAGNPFYGYGDAGPSGYQQPQQPAYRNDADSVYRKPYIEEEVSKARPIYGEQETVAYNSDYGHGYGEEASSYGGYGGYGEEATSYGGYGGYGEYGGYGGHWKKLADDDPARFGGGSVYVEEPVQQAPPPGPATAAAKPFISWW